MLNLRNNCFYHNFLNVFPLLASLVFPLLALVADEGNSSMPIKMAVEQLDPAMDELVPANTKVEKLAEGFLWSEGPAWLRRLGRILRRAG